MAGRCRGTGENAARHVERQVADGASRSDALDAAYVKYGWDTQAIERHIRRRSRALQANPPQPEVATPVRAERFPPLTIPAFLDLDDAVRERYFAARRAERQVPTEGPARTPEPR